MGQGTVIYLSFERKNNKKEKCVTWEKTQECEPAKSRDGRVGAMNTGLHMVSLEDRAGPLLETGDSKSKQTEIKLSAVSTGHMGVLSQKQPSGLHGDPIT